MKAAAAGTTPYTFKNAIASDPHVVTINASLVSRVMVKMKTIQNIIIASDRDLTTSFGYMGSTLKYHGLLPSDDTDDTDNFDDFDAADASTSTGTCTSRRGHRADRLRAAAVAATVASPRAIACTGDANPGSDAPVCAGLATGPCATNTNAPVKSNHRIFKLGGSAIDVPFESWLPMEKPMVRCG